MKYFLCVALLLTGIASTWAFEPPPRLMQILTASPITRWFPAFLNLYPQGRHCLGVSLTTSHAGTNTPAATLASLGCMRTWRPEMWQHPNTSIVRPNRTALEACAAVCEKDDRTAVQQFSVVRDVCYCVSTHKRYVSSDSRPGCCNSTTLLPTECERDSFALVWELRLSCPLDAGRCHNLSSCQSNQGCCVPWLSSSSSSSTGSIEIALLQGFGVIMIAIGVLQTGYYISLRRREYVTTHTVRELRYPHANADGALGDDPPLPADASDLVQRRHETVEMVGVSGAEAACTKMLALFDAPTGAELPEEDCTVCLDELKSAPVVQTPCGHLFHQDCLRGFWVSRLSTTMDDLPCPLCRATCVLQLVEFPRPETRDDYEHLRERFHQRRVAAARERTARDIPEPDYEPPELPQPRFTADADSQRRHRRQNRREALLRAFDGDEAMVDAVLPHVSPDSTVAVEVPIAQLAVAFAAENMLRQEIADAWVEAPPELIVVELPLYSAATRRVIEAGRVLPRADAALAPRNQVPAMAARPAPAHVAPAPPVAPPRPRPHEHLAGLSSDEEPADPPPAPAANPVPNGSRADGGHAAINLSSDEDDRDSVVYQRAVVHALARHAPSSRSCSAEAAPAAPDPQHIDAFLSDDEDGVEMTAMAPRSASPAPPQRPRPPRPDAMPPQAFAEL